MDYPRDWPLKQQFFNPIGVLLSFDRLFSDSESPGSIFVVTMSKLTGSLTVLSIEQIWLDEIFMCLVMPSSLGKPWSFFLNCEGSQDSLASNCHWKDQHWKINAERYLLWLNSKRWLYHEKNEKVKTRNRSIWRINLPISRRVQKVKNNVKIFSRLGNNPRKGVLRSCPRRIFPWRTITANRQSVIEILLKRGRLDLRSIARQTNLSLRITSEALTALIQHGIVRWATVEDGSGEKTFYECFFDDVYHLIRFGKHVQLTEKNAGPEVSPLLSYNQCW